MSTSKQLEIARVALRNAAKKYGAIAIANGRRPLPDSMQAASDQLEQAADEFIEARTVHAANVMARDVEGRPLPEGRL